MNNKIEIIQIQGHISGEYKKLSINFITSVVPVIIYDLIFANSLMNSGFGTVMRVLLAVYVFLCIISMFMSLWKIRKLKKQIISIKSMPNPIQPV